MIEQWDRGITACERARTLDPQKSLYHLWLGRIYGEKADRAGFHFGRGAGQKKSVRPLNVLSNWIPGTGKRAPIWPSFISKRPALSAAAKTKRQPAGRGGCASQSGHGPLGLWLALPRKTTTTAAAEREYRAAIAVSQSLGRALGRARQSSSPHQPSRRYGAGTARPGVRARRPPGRPLLDGASLLLRAGRDYPLAIRLLRRYLESPVEEGPAFKAHDYLGQLLEKQGDRQAAAEEFRAALALSHTYVRAQEDLKRVEH